MKKFSEMPFLAAYSKCVPSLFPAQFCIERVTPRLLRAKRMAAEHKEAFIGPLEARKTKGTAAERGGKQNPA